MLAQTLRLPEELNYLRDYGCEFEYLEATIKYAACLNNYHSPFAMVVDAKVQLENWKWYRDPGPQRLSSEDEIIGTTDTLPLNPSPCSEVAYFRGKSLRLSVVDMKQGTLYLSLDKNLAVVEWLFVNHEKKYFYDHQVTVSKLKDHAFRRPLSTIFS
jgi:hypothetical protein